MFRDGNRVLDNVLKTCSLLGTITQTGPPIGREETRWRTPGRWLGGAARQLPQSGVDRDPVNT